MALGVRPLAGRPADLRTIEQAAEVFGWAKTTGGLRKAPQGHQPRPVTPRQSR